MEIIFEHRKYGMSSVQHRQMPIGFFLYDLLWFGDAGSEQTAVSRGFVVEPTEMDSMDDETKSDLSDRLRYLLAALCEEYTLHNRRPIGKAIVATPNRTVQAESLVCVITKQENIW